MAVSESIDDAIKIYNAVEENNTKNDHNYQHNLAVWKGSQAAGDPFVAFNFFTCALLSRGGIWALPGYTNDKTADGTVISGFEGRQREVGAERYVANAYGSTAADEKRIFNDDIKTPDDAKAVIKTVTDALGTQPSDAPYFDTATWNALQSACTRLNATMDQIKAIPGVVTFGDLRKKAIDPDDTSGASGILKDVDDQLGTINQTVSALGTNLQNKMQMTNSLVQQMYGILTAILQIVAKGNHQFVAAQQRG